MCKDKFKSVEECKEQLYHYTSFNNVFTYRQITEKLRLITTYENTHINLTHDVAKIYKNNFKFVSKYINPEKKPFNNSKKIKEAKELNENIE